MHRAECLLLSNRVCTCEIEGKGNEAVVFAQDAKRLLSLHQCKEVICHSLSIEEVVDTQQKVPIRITRLRTSPYT